MSTVIGGIVMLLCAVFVYNTGSPFVAGIIVGVEAIMVCIIHNG